MLTNVLMPTIGRINKHEKCFITLGPVVVDSLFIVASIVLGYIPCFVV